MKYLAYYEGIESSWFGYSDNLDKLKEPWCFNTRIFEVPEDFNYENFKKLKKPRYKKVEESYVLVYSDGELMHENEKAGSI